MQQTVHILYNAIGHGCWAVTCTPPVQLGIMLATILQNQFSQMHNTTLFSTWQAQRQALLQSSSAQQDRSKLGAGSDTCSHQHPHHCHHLEERELASLDYLMHRESAPVPFNFILPSMQGTAICNAFSSVPQSVWNLKRLNPCMLSERRVYA